MKSFLRVVAGSLLVVLATAPATFGEEPRYSIQLFRGTVAGASFHMTVEARITSTETLFDGEESLGDQVRNGLLRMEADCKVLAVNEEGGITQAEYTVRAFEATVDGNVAPGLSPGQVLETKSVGAGTEIVLRDGELTPLQKVFLAEVLETANPEDTRDDAIFGSAGQHAVGESWSIDSAQAAQELAKLRLLVKEGDLEGSSRLVELRDVEGIPCLHLEGSLEASRFSSPALSPEGQMASRLALSFSGDYPVDTGIPPVGGKIFSYSSVKMQIGSDGEVPLILRRLSESEKSFTFVPVKGAIEGEN